MTHMEHLVTPSNWSPFCHFQFQKILFLFGASLSLVGVSVHTLFVAHAVAALNGCWLRAGTTNSVHRNLWMCYVSGTRYDNVPGSN